MNVPVALKSQALDCALVRHAFFTRRGGASSGVYASLNGGVGSRDDEGAVAENRRSMAQVFAVDPGRFLVPYQIHSSIALPVSGPWAGDRPRCDALVTRTPGLAIGVTGADCGMILFHDRVNGVIGAAHAGWKGALGGVLEATVVGMEALGARRRDIVAALGPTIGRDSYEVGPEFVARFVIGDRAGASFFSSREGSDRSLFDLPSYIGRRLREAEMGEFEDLACDTYADEERFFSYRRSVHRAEPDYGRLVAAIALI